MTMMLLIVVFSAVYYQMYIQNARHFESSKYPSLTYYHFLWYSLMINFTMPLGDIYPLSDAAKAVTAMHGIIFWSTMLVF